MVPLLQRAGVAWVAHAEPVLVAKKTQGWSRRVVAAGHGHAPGRGWANRSALAAEPGECPKSPCALSRQEPTTTWEVSSESGGILFMAENYFSRAIEIN